MNPDAIRSITPRMINTTYRCNKRPRSICISMRSVLLSRRITPNKGHVSLTNDDHFYDTYRSLNDINDGYRQNKNTLTMHQGRSINNIKNIDYTLYNLGGELNI